MLWRERSIKMAEATMSFVSENPIVMELIQLLQDNKMDSQYKDLTQLVTYVDTMEKQLSSVINELQGMKNQLDEITDIQHPLKNACMKMFNTLDANISEAKQKLSEVKNAIVDGAKNAITAFKEKGMASLNSVMNFFKVRNGLNALRNSVNKSITSAEKSIIKIDKMSHEIHEVGSHMRNVGRAMTGKKIKRDVKANGNISKTLQLPSHVKKASMSSMKKRLTVIIDKLVKLDSTVRQNHKETAAKEEKPSILQDTKKFKPPAKEETKKTKAAVKTKKQEESL